LNPIVIGDIVKLEHVLFEQGKATMLDNSYDEIDAVIAMLKDNPNMEIELAGHTDNQGSSKLNYELSEKRVEAVIQYMSDNGINKKRVTGTGYGGSRPIANNNNPTTRQLNRRVEFKIIKE